jgi:DNA-binding NarL/FixJ family response regulator
MINVLIIEDDIVIREAIIDFLSQQPTIRIVGYFASIGEFKLGVPLQDEPHVVLLDIVLPEISGIDGIHHIRNEFPLAAIIMFSVMDDGHSIFQSLCEGAVGYISKDYTMEGLKTAIIDVFEGKGSMSPSIARKVAEYFHPKKS